MMDVPPMRRTVDACDGFVEPVPDLLAQVLALVLGERFIVAAGR
jgi:hypothetical protein